MLTCLPPGPKQPAAAVLLMHGLLADAQPLSDCLPPPALGPGVVNLHRLQDLDQATQCGHRRQSDRGVLATSRGSQACHLVRVGTLHNGQASLTSAGSQAGLTPPKARRAPRRTARPGKTSAAASKPAGDDGLRRGSATGCKASAWPDQSVMIPAPPSRSTSRCCGVGGGRAGL